MRNKLKKNKKSTPTTTTGGRKRILEHINRWGHDSLPKKPKITWPHQTSSWEKEEEETNTSQHQKTTSINLSQKNGKDGKNEEILHSKKDLT